MAERAVKRERGRKTQVFPPGFEPGTSRVLGERDNHYTTETMAMKTYLLNAYLPVFGSGPFKNLVFLFTTLLLITHQETSWTSSGFTFPSLSKTSTAMSSATSGNSLKEVPQVIANKQPCTNCSKENQNVDLPMTQLRNRPQGEDSANQKNNDQEQRKRQSPLQRNKTLCQP